jgi:molecular chaperone Hsp33
MTNSNQGTWVKGISSQGNIRAVGIEARALVQHLVDLHGLKAEGAKALGEATLGALLIASYCKSGERVNLNIQSQGRFAQTLVDAYPDGHMRGYIVERESGGVAEVGQGPWGNGLMSVLRTKDEEGKRPYIGTVPLLTGHLAKDLTYYWVQSEQVPSAVGISVEFDPQTGKIAQAGAFLVQALPGASDEEVKLIESHLKEFPDIQGILAADPNPMNLIVPLLQSSPFHVLETKELKMTCHCSWERVRRALLLIGAEELKAILSTQGQAVVHCDFCTKQYTADTQELKNLIAEVTTH